MGHGIFSSYNSLNVTMRLAGCYIDVVLKLQQQAHNTQWSQSKSQRMLPIGHIYLSMLQALQTHKHRTHLAGDWIQWQKVKIWQVEEDRFHFWHPAGSTWH